MDKTTYQMIKRLDKETHIGMLFCRKALEHNNYDYVKALDYLKSNEFENYKQNMGLY